MNERLKPICSQDAWTKLAQMQLDKHPNIPKHCLPPIEGFLGLKKPNNRNFVSHFMEQVVKKWIMVYYPSWEFHKVENKGKAIPNRYVAKGAAWHGKIAPGVTWVKNSNIIIGEPDLRVRVGNKRLGFYVEIKTPNDKLSPEQIAFAENAPEMVYVIESIDEWIRLVASKDFIIRFVK